MTFAEKLAIAASGLKGISGREANRKNFDTTGVSRGPVSFKTDPKYKPSTPGQTALDGSALAFERKMEAARYGVPVRFVPGVVCDICGRRGHSSFDCRRK